VLAAELEERCDEMTDAFETGIPGKYLPLRIEYESMRDEECGLPPPAVALKDSGARETSITGGMREPAPIEKGAYELLPPGPLHRLAVHYAKGARKYADRNWEKGIETGRIMQSMLRHAFQYLAGKRDEDHLAAVVWNCFALMHHEQSIRSGALPKELDTLPCCAAEYEEGLLP
jgi:hypothetical protein